jgi:hypothetical protein
MTRFENPERYLCPKESQHGKILAEQRRHKGGSPKGKLPSGGRDNVKKKKKDK